MDLEDDLPEDDIDLEEDGQAPFGQPVEEQRSELEYGAALRAAIQRHAAAVSQEAWSESADCVGRVLGLVEGQPGLCLMALADLVVHMRTAYEAEGTRRDEGTTAVEGEEQGMACDHGLEKGVWAERCQALREACAAVGGQLAEEQGGQVDEDQLAARGAAAGLVLAWALEDRRCKEAATAPQCVLAGAGDRCGESWASGLGPLVGGLLMRSPCAPVLRCAELLVEAMPPPSPRPAHEWQLQRSNGGEPRRSEKGGDGEEEGGLRSWAVECLVAALAVWFEGLDVRHLMDEQWAGPPGLGGGVGGARLELKQGAVVAAYPPALDQGPRVVGPLPGADEAGVRERARRLWQEGRPRLGVGRGEDKQSVAALKAMRRLVLREGKEGGTTNKRKRTLEAVGRALVVVVRGEGPRVGGEVLGHALPLCFALMEQYDHDELQVLGVVGWLWCAHRTTPTELSWHLPITLAVLDRALRVVRRPAVLRLLLFAQAELLRLARPAQPEELQKHRAARLEALVGALSRASGVDQRFVLLEGLLRVVRLYAGGYLLVRYLRPLVQVLTSQLLEDADHRLRWLVLAGLEEVVRLCEPMAHQHALHIVAAVARLYLLLHLLCPPGTPHDGSDGADGPGRVRASCASVCVAVQLACAAKPPPAVDVPGSLALLAEQQEGRCQGLQPLLAAVQQQLKAEEEEARVAANAGGLSKSPLAAALGRASPAGGSSRSGGGRGLIEELP